MIRKIYWLAIPVLALVLSGACSTITEELYPCVNYLRFTYTMNMKHVDAFDREVKRIDVFVFDENGRFVTRLSDRSERFGKDYAMELDLPVGKFHLVAWAGLSEESYLFPTQWVEGECPVDRLTVKMRREADATLRRELAALWHAEAHVEIVAGESRTTVLDLIKDTNKLRIVVQGENGMGLNKDVVDFVIRSKNGFLNYDNSLLEDDVVSYKPYYQSDADMGEASSVAAVVAEMNTLRLMENEPTRLVAVDNMGHTLIDIDLIHYLLLTKMEGYSMSAQEYLDRQDEYALIFFLSKDAMGNYMVVQVKINDWIIRPQEGDF
ncbi:FimB/Mfa2 family fimbrial subunit [Alistipes sp.]|uniref:FimB/Mfa2 family fimbrial subunit n=1 Tax=Alistipes sp. TaxID=1872444 RepID=UPI0025B9BDB7|nr:FimB/Mfa2 family fimbrial subunit [Alistipes sp.]